MRTTDPKRKASMVYIIAAMLFADIASFLTANGIISVLVALIIGFGIVFCRQRTLPA